MHSHISTTVGRWSSTTVVPQLLPRQHAGLDEAAHTPGFVGEWNGDVLRAIVRLRTRADLRVVVLDCDQGVGIVRRGSPERSLDLSADDVERLTYTISLRTVTVCSACERLRAWSVCFRAELRLGLGNPRP